MKRAKRWLAAAGLSCLMGIMTAQTALADEPVQPEQTAAGETAAEETKTGGYWIDMEKGPGVARWVDENGNISAPGGGQESEPETAQSEEGGQQPEEAAQLAEGSQQPEGETPAEPGPGAEETAAEETQPVGRVIDPTRPMVALTFDDGPETSVGNQIMDCLAAYGGKATFFVVGNRCPSRAAELQRMVAEGHEVANHSYEHKYFNKLNGAQIQYQVEAANDAIQAACGVRPTLVRLPGGNINATVRANVNYPMIMWSIDTLDWKTRNTQNTVNVVLSQVKDGDIVLMHELYSATGAAALQIIPELTAIGYQLVTVSEMAQARGVALQPGQTYSSFRP